MRGNPPTTNVCGTFARNQGGARSVRGNAARIEVERFVTSPAPTSSFSVGDQPVITTGTRSLRGMPSEIVLGSKLDVEGSLNNGVLTATKVSFLESARVEANITTQYHDRDERVDAT
jgi:hypothetical protein